MKAAVNVAETPGKITADISKVSRAVCEALGAALALDGIDLISVEIVSRDSAEDILYHQRLTFEGEEEE